MKNKKNHSKKEKIIFCILALLLLGTVFLGAFSCMSNPLYHEVAGCACLWTVGSIPPETSYDINEYISGEYKNQPAGDVAAAYFPTLEELGDYEGISYYHADHSMHRSLGNSLDVSLPDLFVLDVRYSEDIFYEKLYEAYCTYVDINTEETVRYYQERVNGTEFIDYYLVEIRLPFEKDQYYMNCFNLAFDENDCIIRYVFGHYLSNDPINNPLHWYSLYTDLDNLEYPPAKEN